MKDRGIGWFFCRAFPPSRPSACACWFFFAFIDEILSELCLERPSHDGTYELFRHYCALPSARDPDGREMAAVPGVVASLLGMISDGATHIAVQPIKSSSRFAMHYGLDIRLAKVSNPSC